MQQCKKFIRNPYRTKLFAESVLLGDTDNLVEIIKYTAYAIYNSFE